jgi:hypothetical protein
MNPTPTYENLAGNFTGTVSGLSQGVTLSGTYLLTLQQSGGTLTGSNTINGTLSDGTSQAPLVGSPTVTGTVALGSNPAVTFTTRLASCPALSSDWTGSYNSATGVLTATGSVRIIDGNCVLLLNFPQTVVLRR